MNKKRRIIIIELIVITLLTFIAVYISIDKSSVKNNCSKLLNCVLK